LSTELSRPITYNVFAVCFRPFWNRCLPKSLNKDTMLLCNCKEKIKNFSTAFAIALMSARLEQTVCYRFGAFFLRLVKTKLSCPHTQKQILLDRFCSTKLGYMSPENLTLVCKQFLSAVRSIRFVSSAVRSTEFSEVNTMLNNFLFLCVATNCKL
jgi:hypothetical protein